MKLSPNGQWRITQESSGVGDSDKQIKNLFIYLFIISVMVSVISHGNLVVLE